jgi:hypothetical protein
MYIVGINIKNQMLILLTAWLNDSNHSMFREKMPYTASLGREPELSCVV